MSTRGLANAEPAPVTQVRATIAEASPVFANQTLRTAEHDRQLRVIAEKHFDFAYMSKSALGTHWKSLSAARRKAFVPLFEDYVLATYLTTLQQNTVEAASNGLRNAVTYDDPKTAVVHGDVHLAMVQEPLHVDYMLCKTPIGWRLFDIVVDNVSTLANYRDQFNEIINADGYDQLV
ncbi:MAG: MlaC/ttg2D family ABC transporter substrate-binding protein, partial [Candidatus Binataceae bacterium]